MKAWSTVALSGALMLSFSWGNLERIEARDLRAELDRTQTRAERQELAMADLSQKIAELEYEAHTLNVVHKALDLSPPLRPEEPPRPEPPSRAIDSAPAASPPVPAAPAFLSLNSIPPSTCLLDGKPLGTTPRMMVEVPPGRHVVQFVTPEVSRTIPVSVSAGETKPVTASLARSERVASDDGF